MRTRNDLCGSCAKWTEGCPWVREYREECRIEGETIQMSEKAETYERLLIHRVVGCSEYEEERR